jgi:hypothetical protein
LAALVCSTGCAQVLGIDETSGPDLTPSTVSIQVQKVLIGASITKSPQDMSMQMATFYDDTAQTLAPVPGVLAGIDTFTAEAPGTPSVIYTVPDVQLPTRMLALAASSQKANYVEFEHANRQDALPMSAFMLNIALPSPYVAGESFTMSAIGAWMAKNLAATTELPAPDTNVSTIAPAMAIPYTAFNPSVAGNPRTRITTADAVLLLRYTNTPSSHLTGVFQAPPFEQTDGTDTVSGTMTAVPAASMASATTTPTDYVTRFAAVRPGVTSALVQSWSINAAPGHSLANDTGVRLINDTLVDPGMGMVPPSAITASYGNPFESLDWKAVMRVSTQKTRSYTYSEGAMSVAFTLAATMITFTEPAMGLNVTMPAGLPITIEANQQTLVTDGMMLTIDPSQPVTIEATLDRATNTAYELNLTELSLDTSGAMPALVRTNRLIAATAGAARFRIPPELFTVGKSYYITIRSYQGGLPNVADGDIQAITLPYSLAQLDSAVFTVGMP